MKRLAFLFLASIISLSVSAQDQDSTSGKAWEFNPDLNLYLIPDDFFILPIMRADRDWLHLEARYNYEDRETFSGWVGYNFTGGKKLKHTITPMIGGAFGLTQGFTTGLVMTFELGKFELYTESEYLFDSESKENNFYYNWSDLTYSPTDWLWVGLSGQRTKVYQTDLDIQRGILIGVGYKSFELTTYVYNIGFDDPFVLLTFSAYF